MRILLTRKFFLPTFVIAIFYITFVIYSMNITLVLHTIFGNFPMLFKVTLLLALLEGMWTTMTHLSLLLLIITGFLTGANISLLSLKLQSLGGLKNMHLLVGGSSMLGIMGSGCVSCGLPIISLLGLTGSIMYLPFHGAEIAAISVLFLAVSFFVLLKNNNSSSCAIKSSKIKKQVEFVIKPALLIER